MWKTTGSGLAAWALSLGLAAGAITIATQAQAAPLGTVTIADGRAHLARGTTVYSVTEGLSIEEADLLDLEEGALVQVELADGTALSFTAKAQALLPAAGAGGKRSDLFLAGGWVKFGLAAAGPVSAVATPHLRLVSQPAVYVMGVAPETSQVFVEAGELVPVFAVPKAGQPVVVKANEYLGVKADSSVTQAARAPQPFVAAMPRLYMDKLPPRLARLKARGVTPKIEREAGFADLDAWVKRYPLARPWFIELFRPKLVEADFVAALEPAIKSYPEYEAALRPEKGRKGGAKDKPKAPAK
jgi:hypothetical protein